MTDLLTITDLAAHFHRDRRSVMAALKDTPPATEAKVAGKRVRRWRLADVQDALTEPSDHDRLAEAFERLHSARAEILRLKRALRTGILLRLDVVILENDDRVLNLRSACLSVPMRFRSEIEAALGAKDPVGGLRRGFRAAAAEILSDLKLPFTWSKRSKK